MTFTEAMEWTSRGFEVAAVAVLVVGFLAGIVKALGARIRKQEEESYAVLRRYFGRSILLGLEIFVAADLIKTVAIDQTWENVLSLGPDRPHPDLPQLLARDRDRRHRAVAPLGDGKGLGEDPAAGRARRGRGGLTRGAGAAPAHRRPR